MRRSFLLLGITLTVGAIAPLATSQSSPLAAQPSLAQPAAAPRLPQLSRHPTVALTFDDLPSAGTLPAGDQRARIATTLTSELKANHLEGTYGFVNAVRLENDPDAQQALRIWIDAGMNIGNHTWSHPSLTDNTAEAYEREIARGEPALAQYAEARDWHWFRYPYLEEGETLAKREAVRGWLLRHHYRIAEVTIDFEDYMWNDTYGRCADQHNSAAIASLHDSYLATADEYITYSRSLSRSLYGRDIPYVLLLHVGAFDAKMLPELVALYRKRGFQFVTLPQAEADPAYSADPAIAYPGGGLLMELEAARRNVALPTGASEPEAELDKMCR